MKKLLILVAVLMTACGTQKSMYVKEGQRVHRKEIAHRVGKQIATWTFISVGVCVIVIEQRRD